MSKSKTQHRRRYRRGRKTCGRSRRGGVSCTPTWYNDPTKTGVCV